MSVLRAFSTRLRTNDDLYSDGQTVESDPSQIVNLQEIMSFLKLNLEALDQDLEDAGLGVSVRASDQTVGGGYHTDDFPITVTRNGVDEIRFYVCSDQRQGCNFRIDQHTKTLTGNPDHLDDEEVIALRQQGYKLSQIASGDATSILASRCGEIFKTPTEFMGLIIEALPDFVPEDRQAELQSVIENHTNPKQTGFHFDM